MLEQPTERFRRLLQSYEGKLVTVHLRGSIHDDFSGLALGWGGKETQTCYEVRIADGSLAVLEPEDEPSIAGVHSRWEDCPLCCERR